MARLTALVVTLVMLVTLVAPNASEVLRAANCGGNLIVNTAADTAAVNALLSPNDAGGNISLRSAIMFANVNAGVDTICLDPVTYTLTLGPADLDAIFGTQMESGDLDIFGSPLTIIGLPGTIVQAGTTKSSSVGTGNGIDRVFHIDGVNVTMQSFTIRYGKGAPGSAAPGGGIYFDSSVSNATLTLTAMTITDNFSNVTGGGLANFGGVVNMTNSTVSNNIGSLGGGILSTRGGFVGGSLPSLSVVGSQITGNMALGVAPGGVGGGILVPVGSFAMSNSTVSGNTASISGGGLYLAPPTGVSSGITAVILTSTIAHNNAANAGAGIFNRGNLSMTNSTVSSNVLSASTLGGAGIYTGTTVSQVNSTNNTIADNRSNATGAQFAVGGGGSQVTLRNTIIAQGGGGTAGNCFNVTTINSAGGNVSSDATCPLTDPADKVNANPNLQALALNNGTTLTHMLATGSAAIDAGVSTGCPATDQRGVARPLDGDGNGTALCDSGAVEAPATITIPSVSTATPTATLVPPTPTPTPFVPLMIPQAQQNPGAIAIIQGIAGNGTRNNTPVPARPAGAVAPAAASGGAPAGALAITPPRTGDAGLLVEP